MQGKVEVGKAKEGNEGKGKVKKWRRRGQGRMQGRNKKGKSSQRRRTQGETRSGKRGLGVREEGWKDVHRQDKARHGIDRNCKGKLVFGRNGKAKQ